jgi:hypothetical protein
MVIDRAESYSFTNAGFMDGTKSVFAESKDVLSVVDVIPTGFEIFIMRTSILFLENLVQLSNEL